MAEVYTPTVAEQAYGSNFMNEHGAIALGTLFTHAAEKELWGEGELSKRTDRDDSETFEQLKWSTQGEVSRVAHELFELLAFCPVPEDGWRVTTDAQWEEYQSDRNEVQLMLELIFRVKHSMEHEWDTSELPRDFIPVRGGRVKFDTGTPLLQQLLLLPVTRMVNKTLLIDGKEYRIGTWLGGVTPQAFDLTPTRVRNIKNITAQLAAFLKYTNL